MKRLAVLTSGGDCPGMNAAIAAFTRAAARKGVEVLGVKQGFEGLVAGEFLPLSADEALQWGALPGTVLGTSRRKELLAEEGLEKARKKLAEVGLEGLLLLGGDGSFRYGAPFLQRLGLPFVGVPATIDNDIGGTDYTLGFDSAVNFTAQMVQAVRATACALPGRLFFVETLGGDTGHIALYTAYLAQADYVLVPKVETDFPAALRAFRRALEAQGYAIAVASEGVPDLRDLAERLSAATGCRLRFSATGHAARGAPCSAFDCYLGRAFAEKALELLLAGRGNRLLAWRGQVVDLPFEQAPPRASLDLELLEKVTRYWEERK